MEIGHTDLPQHTNEKLQEEIQKIEDEMNWNVLIYTRTEISESGERPTTYFYKLWKKLKKENTITTLI